MSFYSYFVLNVFVLFVHLKNTYNVWLHTPKTNITGTNIGVSTQKNLKYGYCMTLKVLNITLL